MPNIYQNISSNKRDTVVIMVLFIAVVSFIGWFVGNYFYDGSGVTFLSLALIFSGISGLASYYTSDKIVLAISSAREVSHDEAPDLYNLVENMSIASGIPMPKVYIIDDSSMNAFATGRDPNHGVICFTSGIIQRLEKRELEGVVAHEMSHIGDYDTRLMCIVSVLVGSVSLLSNWMTRGFFFRGRRRSSSDGGELGGILFVIGLVLLILSPIIATLIKLAISRNREYLADSSAALITRYPNGLANALRKISQDTEILEAANSATAHLYITDPVRDRVGSSISNLFNTHPTIEERIKRLEAM